MVEAPSKDLLVTLNPQLKVILNIPGRRVLTVEVGLTYIFLLVSQASCFEVHIKDPNSVAIRLKTELERERRSRGRQRPRKPQPVETVAVLWPDFLRALGPSEASKGGTSRTTQYTSRYRRWV